MFNYRDKIVILAGIHGNEPGPSVFLQQAVKNPSFWNGLVNKVTVFPAINKYGLKKNQRHDENDLDLNRSWFLKNGPAFRKLQVIKNKLVGCNLVLDFHEAWGFHRCSDISVGQSIFIPKSPCYLNGILFKELAEKAVLLLNNSVVEECDKWDVRFAPKIHGDCRSYCSAFNIPYILIEMAGQNNVRSMERRHKNMEIILKVFLSYK